MPGLNAVAQIVISLQGARAGAGEHRELHDVLRHYLVSLVDGQAEGCRLRHVAGGACYRDRVGSLGRAVVSRDRGGSRTATTTADREH